jgi:phenylpyruvate tautomerase PptA (4-oxalocrotonate tautomerase family)
MTPADTQALSRNLCERLEKALGVSPERIYVELTDAVDTMWGWNGDTFGW